MPGTDAKPLIDENRLYRRMPLLKRLVPSLKKRIARVFPSRTPPAYPVRLVRTSARAIHIFGDSHCGLFDCPPYQIMHYLGPVTMHRVGRQGVATFGLQSLDIKPGDALGFVFGEIDVRVHVAKQRDAFGRRPDEIIDTLAAGYLTTLGLVKRSCPVGSPIVVFSLIPPAGEKYPFLNREFPRNGTDAERADWTLQLNERLKTDALRAGFGFVDQYSRFANGRGLLARGATRDGTHVAPNRPIELTCEWGNAVER